MEMSDKGIPDTTRGITSYLNSISLDLDIVPGRDYLIFDSNKTSLGSGISHKTESDAFMLKDKGTYYVTFHTIGYYDVRQSALVDIAVALKCEERLVDGSYAQESVTLAREKVNLSFSVILEALGGETLKVKNLSQETVRFMDSSICIIRLR